MSRALAVAVVALAVLPATAAARRAIPDTTAAIHVWNDQLPDDMTDAQVAFVAHHVDGTQKVSRETAVRLRAAGHPGFLVLHYRLGIGDGPVPFRIGDRWASDYASVRSHGSWFWHERGRRVFQRQWRWYLMNPSSGWRAYWARRVLHEAGLLGDDGVFADSLSVPQYLGPDGFSPPLRFFVGEAAWTRRIDAFMRYEERALRGRLWFIPNAGSWITTRDRTDYAIPDGVMIEGFAAPGDGSYAAGDWLLQMNRVLGLARRGRIVIGRSYPSTGDVRARMFDLASYLLTKGRHSFVNLLTGTAPQWFPEYGIDLGAPVDPLALHAVDGVYVRRFERGVALVNPDDVAHAYAVDGLQRLVEPHGGGTLGAGADVSPWGLTTRPVSGTLTLAAHSGAILLH